MPSTHGGPDGGPGTPTFSSDLENREPSKVVLRFHKAHFHGTETPATVVSDTSGSCPSHSSDPIVYRDTEEYRKGMHSNGPYMMAYL